MHTRRTTAILVGVALGWAAGCEHGAVDRVGLVPEPRDVEAEVLLGVVRYLGESEGRRTLGTIAVAESLGTRWTVDGGRTLRDSLERRAHAFIPDLVSRNAAPRRIPRVALEPYVTVHAGQARPGICARPGSRATNAVRISRPAIVADAKSAFVIVEAMCPETVDPWPLVLTLQLEHLAGVWRVVRIQTIPPDPRL